MTLITVWSTRDYLKSSKSNIEGRVHKQLLVINFCLSLVLLHLVFHILSNTLPIKRQTAIFHLYPIIFLLSSIFV